MVGEVRKRPTGLFPISVGFFVSFVILVTSADARLVMELNEAVDLDNERDVERELNHHLHTGDARLVVIDITTPLVTTTLLHVLVRLRDSAHARGAVLHVVARRPMARQIIRLAGLARLLRLCATVSGTQAAVRGCPPAHFAAAGGGAKGRARPSRLRDRVCPR
jgi:anti-anti-sigma regulatory factor